MNIFSKKMKEIFVPIVLLVIFFATQATGMFGDGVMFWILLVFNLIVFYLVCNKDEYKLYLIGVVAGILIEARGELFSGSLHLGMTSFMGVPYWMVLVWGLGVVLITRVGVAVRRM